MKNTQDISKKLKWTLWLCVGVLILALGLLAALELHGAKKRSSLEQTQPTESQSEETQATQPEQTEPTLPVLDIPKSPYGPEDFGFQEQYRVCTAGPCMVGIDVSAWQENVDWTQVKEAGIEFVMIRLAWRGSSEGGIFEDQLAAEHYEGAKAAGLKVGGYFFSQAITPQEAVEEAEFLLSMVEDWQIDLPLAFDWEFAGGPRTDGMDAQGITDCAKAFCQTIEAAGFDSMIYFNPHMAYYQIDLETLEEYGLWLAMWDSEMTFPYKVNMWQYTDQGSVPGIAGNVDLDLYLIYGEE